MQKQTADQIQNLSERLTPLSPSGSIPGLHDVTQDPFDSLGAPGEYDPNAFIDFDTGWDGGGEGDFDFGFDTSGNENWGSGFDGGAAGGEGDMFDGKAPATPSGLLAPQQSGDGGRVESVSSEATSPAATVEEDAVPGTPSKRLRRS
jgi:heat shock transcription factor